MLGSNHRTMFHRAGLGALAPVGGLGLDYSDARASPLTPKEQAEMREAIDGGKNCCDACRASKCLDPCVNGVRVLTRDDKGNPTAAEACTGGSTSTGSSGLTPDQQKQIADALVKGGTAAAKALIDQFTKKNEAAPPPTSTNLIGGIPNVVLIGAGIVVVLVVGYVLLRK